MEWEIRHCIDLRRGVAALLVIGTLTMATATTTRAATAAKESGSLVASGAVHGRWTMTKCSVGVTQGSFVLDVAYGPTKKYPNIVVSAQEAGDAAVVASRTGNLATTQADQIVFQVNATSSWVAGVDYTKVGSDYGSGVLSMSATLKSGSFSANTVRQGSRAASPEHLTVKWTNCATRVIPEN